MVDTETLRFLARHLRNDGNTVSAANVDAAADEIDDGRNARLVQYRCATLAGLLAAPDIVPSFQRSTASGTRFAQWVASEAEGYAHAMLAAERPVKP